MTSLILVFGAPLKYYDSNKIRFTADNFQNVTVLSLGAGQHQ